MKDKHKIFIVALLLSLTLAVCTVSATDDVTFEQSNLTTVSIETNDDKDKLSVSDEIDSEGENSLLGDGENLYVDGDKFENINKTISDAKSGDTIFLQGKTYTGTEAIQLNKDNLTIIGGSNLSDSAYATLDAKDLTQIMRISGANVVIKNIKFINANTTERGGAIFGYSLSYIHNCIFQNNAARLGGAIFGGNLNIFDCIFDNNTAVSAGAFYNSGGQITITNSIFTNNVANDSGGAVFLSHDSYIINSTFKNNNASNSAGAVYMFGTNSRVSDSLFENNTAKEGGAINVAARDATVRNVTFTNNAARLGGAIYWQYGSGGHNGIVSDSKFENNSATQNAGAIYWTGHDGTVKNATFINNKAANVAGAVHWSGPRGRVIDSKFENNSVNNLGGAIYWFGVNGTVLNSEFKNNKGKFANIYDPMSYLILLGNCTLEAIVKISQINDCLFNSNATVNVTFDYGTNYGNYSVILYNNNMLLQEFPYNSSYIYLYTWDKLEYGNYSITVRAQGFNGNSYVANYDPMTFHVYKYNSTVNINPIDNVDYGKNVVVTFNVVNKTTVMYEVRDNAGKVVRSGVADSDSLTLTGLAGGNYIITITNGESENYSSSSDSANFTVLKQNTNIAASNIVTFYNGGKYLVASLKDEKGNVVANAQVQIVIGGKTHTLRTGSNGQVKLSTDSLSPKSYNAKIVFNGDAKYNKSEKTITVTVKKANVKLVPAKKTFKFKAKQKTKKIKVTLKDSKKKAVKKAKVTLKITGKKVKGKKTFILKTNKKGVVTFKITSKKTKFLKKGKYGATIKYNGNGNYNKVTKKIKITIK